MRQQLSGLPVPPKDSTQALLLSGAAAGGVSKLLTAPIDRVKIMYQVSTSRPFSISSGMRTAIEIVRTSGVTALWRGNSIAVLRDVPYAAIMFSVRAARARVTRAASIAALPQRTSHAQNAPRPQAYALVEEIICGRTQRSPDVWTRSLSGALAGMISTCLTYPLDMLRARFGAEWAAQPRYASYSQGVREIVRAEGFSALFSGLRPTLLGIMPYSALSFAAFETLKAMLKQRAEDERRLLPGDELPVRQKLLAGGAAGLFAQTSTYPLHVVRRRMQAGGATAQYTSTWHGLRTIYATEGVVSGLCTRPHARTLRTRLAPHLRAPSLCVCVLVRACACACFADKGLTLTFVKGPLQSAIGFTVNDRCKAMLREWESESGPQAAAEPMRTVIIDSRGRERTL